MQYYSARHETFPGENFGRIGRTSENRTIRSYVSLTYLTLFIFIILQVGIGQAHNDPIGECCRTAEQNNCKLDNVSECYRAPDGKIYDTTTITIDCSEIADGDRCGDGRPDNDNVVILGFLLPRVNGENFMLGALTWAVFQANLNHTNVTFKFCAEESGEAGKFFAMRKMTAMRSHGVRAFIGPDESCMSEAVLAAAWDLPMITYKCPDKRVSNKQLFPTFARTMPPSSKYSKFVIALLLHYKWKDIIIIAGLKPSWLQIVEALEDLARDSDVRVTDKQYLPAEYTSRDIGNITKIVAETYDKTRVYVFVADNEALIDFARYMEKQDYLSKGEYVIISVDDEIHNEGDSGQYIMKVHDKHLTFNETMALPFRSVLKLTPSPPIDSGFDTFMDTVRNLSTKSPFNVPKWLPYLGKPHVPIYAAHIYDAVTIFAKAMNDVIAEGLDPNNVTHIMKKIFNTTYRSIQGFDVFIDKDGDAEGNFTVLGLVKNENSPAKRSMKQIWKFYPGPPDKLPLIHDAGNGYEVDWIAGKPPENQPTCGFNNEKCDKALDWKTIIICTVVVFLLVAAIFAFRHYRYEQKLACLLWKIDYKEIYPISSESEQLMSKKGIMKFNQEKARGSFFGALPTENSSTDYNTHQRKPFTKIGKYKGEIVAIKCINKRSIDLTRNIRKELKQIRELRHDNINTFIGACVDHPNICIITTYCARGSLEDVIKNEDLHFDNMFVASLVADLLRGMIYLHDSEIQSHGNLKSSNCLVDSKLVLQITDFGLHEFKANPEERLNNGLSYYKGLLFRAPELLRMSTPPAQGTTKGDVYSFAIILHHVITRQDPWEYQQDTTLDSTKAVCDMLSRIKNPTVKDGASSGLYCRPSTRGIHCLESVLRCMREAWDENPESRPDFRTIRNKLKEMQAGLKPNIFDNMMTIMEKYALNLEGIVQERAQQLMEEKRKTDTLLHRMLPKSVAESLIRGNPVEAESFNMVTIYFSDIVGFTTLSAESTPLEVVDLLNDLYTACDRIIGRFDVYKVETIGDAYMVVSGLPIKNGQTHAREIAKMALALLEKIKNFKIKHRPGETLKLRIGIHSGPCVAGVVGLKMPRYCLFGDTVNTASRMESTGEALKIHVSEVCKTILDELGGFILQERGLIPVKGKGEMRTFWLVKEDPNRSFEKTDTESDIIQPNLENVKNYDIRKNGLNGLINATCTYHPNVSKTSNGKCVQDTVIDDLDSTSSPNSSLPGSPLLPIKQKPSMSEGSRPHKNIFNQVTSKVMKKYTNGTLGNCSSTIQECKENLLNEVKKNGHTVMGCKYKACAVPIIPSKSESYV